MEDCGEFVANIGSSDMAVVAAATAADAVTKASLELLQDVLVAGVPVVELLTALLLFPPPPLMLMFVVDVALVEPVELEPTVPVVPTFSNTFVRYLIFLD